ncbi:unnamed protein product [Penicillium olsonii]|nr:unnamed protein product [Penicillium olsonii]
MDLCQDSSHSVAPARLPRASLLTNLPPSLTHDIMSTTDERRTTLRRLLLEGHSSLAPLREPKLILHSHLPHVSSVTSGEPSMLTPLASRVRIPIRFQFRAATGALRSRGNNFGACRRYVYPGQQLVTPGLEELSRQQIVGALVPCFHFQNLTRSSHTVAYVDFFDNEIKSHDGDWKAVMAEYLFSGPEPLLNGLVGGLGHPFIHLAYAWELQSPTVATEGLSLACTEYIPLHSIIDRYPPDNSSYKTKNLAEVLNCVQKDDRLNDLFTSPGITNIDTLLQTRYDVLLEHWNAWEGSSPLQQLEECCDLSLLLGLGTGSETGKFDFYLIHTITVAQAIRVLWHFIPEERHAAVMRQYAVFFLLVYICQLKPVLPTETISVIDSVELKGRDWSWVHQEALNHRWAKDSHFFKVVRAPQVFEQTFGPKNNHYLKASIKFLAEFDGWQGFGEGVAGFLPDRDGFHPDKE